MRAAQGQAKNAVDTANSTAAGYGAGASNIASTLTPFLTRELNSPGGYSQGDQSAMIAAAEGGAGGEGAGLQSRVNEEAAATGNPSGFASSAGDIARERMKAAAGSAEGIAAQNADLKQKQQQEGAAGLSSMYGTDTAAQLKAMGLIPEDVNSEVNAGKSGWLQNLEGIVKMVQGGAGAAGDIKGLFTK